MVPEATTVAVIGGGPVGLVCSILLSLQEVAHALFERQPGTSIHPKAIGLKQRNIEIFRKIGVEDEVLRQAAPPSMSGRTAWYTSLGPSGREICTRHAWGGGPYKEIYEKASPRRYCLLPQIRLKPILRSRAQESNPKGMFYSHEVETVHEDTTSAVVHFHERKEAGQTPSKALACKFVIGADGGRFLTDHLGIKMNGESDIVDIVNTYAHQSASIDQILVFSCTGSLVRGVAV